MHLFFEIGTIKIPGYGLMIVLGILFGNGIAIPILKKRNMDWNDFLILEGYTFLGAVVGAKLLYLLTSLDQIQWDRLTDLNYLNSMMQGGFVFYGGLFGGLGAVILASRFHHIDGKRYLHEFLILIPLMHGFGRLGCFMAGCCYGRAYEGPFSVVYPHTSLATDGIALFPVQPVEAGLLFLLSVLVFWAGKRGKNTILTYFTGYALIRLVTEFFRGDGIRGHFLWFSTSQWISILVLCGILCYYRFFMKKN